MTICKETQLFFGKGGGGYGWSDYNLSPSFIQTNLDFFKSEVNIFTIDCPILISPKISPISQGTLHTN